MHLADTAKAGQQFVDLAVEHQAFLFGQQLKFALFAHALEPVQLVDALAHGEPVGQHTAQPAEGDIRHAAAQGFFFDRFDCLAFGANEQHGSAFGDGLADHVPNLIHRFDSLLQVDDMDAVALREDVRTHLGVPPVCTVTEVDAAFQQRLHRNTRH